MRSKISLLAISALLMSGCASVTLPTGMTWAGIGTTVVGIAGAYASTQTPQPVIIQQTAPANKENEPEVKQPEPVINETPETLNSGNQNEIDTNINEVFESVKVDTWAPFDRVVFDPKGGKAEFTLRGISPTKMRMNGDRPVEWSMFNLKGNTHNGGWQQCHPITWYPGTNIRLTCQQFDRSNRLVSDNGPDHVIRFDPAKAYRFVMEWDMRSVSMSIFDGDNRTAHLTKGTATPWVVMTEAIAADSVFPGYPGLGGIEYKDK